MTKEMSRTVLCWLACITVLSPAPAIAHFNLEVNIRVFHMEHNSQDDGLRLLIRQPLSYLLADKLVLDQSGKVVREAPYSRSVQEGDKLVHYLDVHRLRESPNELTRMVADGYRLSVNGEEKLPAPGRIRIHPVLDQPPFALLEEAIAAMEGPVFDPIYPDSYIGELIVDTELHYPGTKAAATYSLRSTLNPGLSGQENTANILIDHGDEQELVLRKRGLLEEPLTVTRNLLDAMATFGKHGVVHILEGWDHVLFVLCLLLGARRLGGLIWRITGFTIGHSITLSLGFFGYVPAGTWFIPLVETGIALSIIYAAIVALMNPEVEPRGVLLVTSLLGLLHGLGFSFVLENLLQLDSLHIWESLASFNVGVELGQLLIVLAVWPLFHWLCGRFPGQENWLRWAIAGPSLVIAAYWTGERFFQLLATI